MGPLKSLEHYTPSLRNKQDSSMGSRRCLFPFLYEDPFPSQEIRKTGVAFIALIGRLSRIDDDTLLAAFTQRAKSSAYTLRNREPG